MIKLQSFKYPLSEYGIFNNNSFEIIQGQLTVDDVSQMDGFFCILNSSVYLFKKNKTNHFFYRNRWYELTEKSILNYYRLNEFECSLQWKNKESTIFSIKYYQPNYGLIDRLGYTEDESDYNFGLWLYKYHFHPKVW